MDIKINTLINSKASREEKLNIEEQLIEYAKGNKDIDDIICPRCGEKIIFTEIGNSYTVQCETFGCIKYSVRGL